MFADRCIGMMFKLTHLLYSQEHGMMFIVSSSVMCVAVLPIEPRGVPVAVEHPPGLRARRP